MKKGLLVLIGAVVLVGLWLVAGYNGFVRRQQEVSGAWAQVENVLQRRFDLVPNLVETVKGYAKHEKELFEGIARLRSQWSAAPTQGEKMKAANGMESALGRLMVVMENYPALKADQSFLKLQDELAGTENRIAVERMRYNDAVKAYNTSVQMFPGVLLARVFGFAEKPYFEAQTQAKDAPKVSFQ